MAGILFTFSGDQTLIRCHVKLHLCQAASVLHVVLHNTFGFKTLLLLRQRQGFRVYILASLKIHENSLPLSPEFVTQRREDVFHYQIGFLLHTEGPHEARGEFLPFPERFTVGCTLPVCSRRLSSSNPRLPCVLNALHPCWIVLSIFTIQV